MDRRSIQAQDSDVSMSRVPLEENFFSLPRRMASIMFLLFCQHTAAINLLHTDISEAALPSLSFTSLATKVMQGLWLFCAGHQL